MYQRRHSVSTRGSQHSQSAAEQPHSAQRAQLIASVHMQQANLFLAAVSQSWPLSALRAAEPAVYPSARSIWRSIGVSLSRVVFSAFRAGAAWRAGTCRMSRVSWPAYRRPARRS